MSGTSSEAIATPLGRKEGGGRCSRRSRGRRQRRLRAQAGGQQRVLRLQRGQLVSPPHPSLLPVRYLVVSKRAESQNNQGLTDYYCYLFDQRRRREGERDPPPRCCSCREETTRLKPEMPPHSDSIPARPSASQMRLRVPLTRLLLKENQKEYFWSDIVPLSPSPPLPFPLSRSKVFRRRRRNSQTGGGALEGKRLATLYYFYVRTTDDDVCYHFFIFTEMLFFMGNDVYTKRSERDRGK